MSKRGSDVDFQQISIFDYDSHTRSLDTVRQQLEHLQLEETLHIDALTVTRTEKFYVVERGNDFEEPFRSLDEAYRFINHIGGC